MNKYLKQSIILHVIVFLILVIDVSGFWHHDMTLGQTPIIVDLSQVRIDEMTNLPSKAEFGPEDRKAMVEEHQPQEQYANDSSPEAESDNSTDDAKVEVKEDMPEEIKEDFLEPPVPDKKPEKKPDPKPDTKPASKKTTPVPSRKPKPQPKPESKPQENKKPQEQASVRSNALKSLMQELDNSKNLDIGDKTQSAMIKEGTEVKHMGIEGGNSNGSYFSDLTISETDAIASLLRQNWNLDPGAIGIEGMVVEIRVSLAKDGSIQKIEFVDQRRFNSDPAYRSVAESAQRAIYATQEAFKEVFGRKYADRYDVWSTLRLYFDPLNKGIR